MRNALLILGVLVALAVPAAASAKTPPPQVCGSAGQGDCGSGGVSGCATVSTTGDDGYGDRVTSNYHWCWSAGSIWGTYGWADYSLGSGFNSFLGYSANTNIPNGHLAIAHFDGVDVNFYGVKYHHDVSARACVQVDGWGNSWGC